VVRLAREHFTFLEKSAATVDIVVGDGRIVMERELLAGQGGGYDLLVLDAFSSDAIPVHLLSRECFQLYRQHLRPGGMLLIHITNRFLDLEPVVRAQGELAGLRTALLVSPGDPRAGTGRASWMVLDSGSGFLDLPNVKPLLAPPRSNAPRVPVWTDDFASLWQILKQ
jgi:hypothetical protein